MLALLADEPHAATSHQPLRGAALLAAALSAYLRGGGTSDPALSGLQAAVRAVGERNGRERGTRAGSDG